MGGDNFKKSEFTCLRGNPKSNAEIDFFSFFGPFLKICELFLDSRIAKKYARGSFCSAQIGKLYAAHQ